MKDGKILFWEFVNGEIVDDVLELRMYDLEYENSNDIGGILKL